MSNNLESIVTIQSKKYFEKEEEKKYCKSEQYFVEIFRQDLELMERKKDGQKLNYRKIIKQDKKIMMSSTSFVLCRFDNRRKEENKI